MVGPTTKSSADNPSWEDLKDVIRTMYLVEDKSLGEVKNKLAKDYGFETTKAQLELYFKKWDFRKNLSSEEWIAVAHKITKRKRDEKESEFKSVVNIQAHTLLHNPGSVETTSATNTDDFQASIVEHFGERIGKNDRSSAFHRNLKAALPRYVVNGHAADLQTTRTSSNSLHAVDFLNLTLFIFSNNLLRPDFDTSSKAYEWIKRHSTACLIEYLLSINEPTVEALAEQIFALAIRMKDANIVQKILDSGLNPNELRCIDESGQQITPLQRACQFPNADIVRVLLDAGADVNLCLSNYCSPLAIAIAHFDDRGNYMDHVGIELVQLLLRAGANVNPAVGSSPLIEAAANAHLELVSVLLAAGADPNFSEEHTGMTPLHYVCISNGPVCDTIDIARQLLQAGANASAECSSSYDDERTSVLEQSTHPTKAELIKLLLDRGALVTERALILAVETDNLDIVKLFLSHEAPLTKKVIENATSCGEPEIFWFLLDSAKIGVRKELQRAAFVAAIHHNNKALINALSKSDLKLRKTGELRAAIKAAAGRGDISVLRLLLNDGSPHRSVAVELLEGALGCAIANGRVEVTDLLLTAGVDVNIPSGDSQSTPLREAICKRDADLIQRLLAAGAAVDTEKQSFREIYSPFSASVLPEAVSWGDYSCIRDILDAGADVNALDPLNNKTALMVAVEKNDFPTIHLLIDNGADVNAFAVQAIGYTALVAAVENNAIDMAQFLLDLGAVVNEQALVVAIPKSQQIMQMLLTSKLGRAKRYPCGFGCRALQHAIAGSNAGMIQLLLLNSIDPNSIVRHGYTVDHSTRDDLPISTWIDGYGKSALGLAIRLDKSKDLWVINMLLLGGSNVNKIVDERTGQDALTAAVDESDLRLVEKLLSVGADVNLRLDGRRSRTPLQLAVERGLLDIAVTLLEHGADVNAPPYDRATALQFAAIKGYLGIAVVMVEKGADINAAPAKVGGRTALEGAAEHGRIDMLQFLLNAGAQVKGPGSRQYERARSFASENGHIAARRLLERHHSQQPEHQTTGKSVFDYEAWDVWD
ncbi:hypothetical protein LTR84_005464 [Exophiala bonariae]|uniref:Clr5 domain-containing protein n=1 Tax=Exophiala bonariae TaxID=1690606 RepID=A0AAV9N3V3_9EURO|nr:hypothetical protein LTR84_005464 [Exophiala bonariae]